MPFARCFDDVEMPTAADWEKSAFYVRGSAKITGPFWPEDLPRVQHRHEPESTDCTCGAAMVRVGEDVSEELDIVRAQYSVHRHIYGKWACRCCQVLKQEPAAPHIIDGGIPAAGLRGAHDDQPLRGSPAVLPAGDDCSALARAHAHARRWHSARGAGRGTGAAVRAAQGVRAERPRPAARCNARWLRPACSRTCW
jgi:hypothetical protein